jgi:hypothetical protein
MHSPDATVREIKTSLVRSSSDLAKQLAAVRSVEGYRDAVCRYISSAMCGTTQRQWLDTIGWVYTGVHVASELQPDYVSLTFSPCSDKQDERAHDYLNGSEPFTTFNFTKFLWPGEADLRDKLFNPLEMMIETRANELASFIESEHQFQLDNLSQENSRIVHPDNYLPAILVPNDLRLWFRRASSARPTEAAMRVKGMSEFLKSAKIYLKQHFLQEVNGTYDISETQLYEATCNTLLLHKITDVEPRAVIFFPFVAGLNRIGVFCMVTSMILSSENRTRLQSIAETALANIFAVDTMLTRQREKMYKASVITPLLAHNCRSTMYEAALKVRLALNTLRKQKAREANVSLLSAEEDIERAAKAINKSEEYLRILEERVFDEAFKSSEVTPSSLQRQVRLLIPPEFVEKVEWVVDGSYKLTIPFSPAILAEAMAQLVINSIRAVGESRREEELKWCSVLINSEGTEELVVTIQDIGPGLSQEQQDSLNFEVYKPMPSTHDGGYGIKTTCWAIRNLGGEIALSETGQGGTTWIIKIPCVQRLRKIQSCTNEVLEVIEEDGRLLSS